MDLDRALQTTGAVRDFSAHPVPDEVVHHILETARYAAALRCVFQGDVMGAHASFAEAAQIADRFKGVELTTLARIGEGRCLIYAGEIARTTVRANLIDPAIARTRLRARIFPGENPETVPPPERVVEAFLDLAVPECTRNGETVTVTLAA